MYHYRLSNKVGRCRPPSVEILSSTAPVRILCILHTASSVKPTLAPLSAPSSHCPWELHPHPLPVSAICVRHRSLPSLPAPAQTCSLSPGCPSQKPSAHLPSIPGALPTERYSMLQPVCDRRLPPGPLSSVKDISSWLPPLPLPTSCPRHIFSRRNVCQSIFDHIFCSSSSRTHQFLKVKVKLLCLHCRVYSPGHTLPSHRHRHWPW